MNYEAKQKEWLKSNNLKSGDRVKVTRKPTNDELGGWNDSWTSMMDGAIGREFIIISTIEKITLDFYGFNFPFQALEPVSNEGDGLVQELPAWNYDAETVGLASGLDEEETRKENREMLDWIDSQEDKREEWDSKTLTILRAEAAEKFLSKRNLSMMFAASAERAIRQRQKEQSVNLLSLLSAMANRSK